MTIPEYNKVFYPQYNKALCFVMNLNHALQKSDDNACMQMECIGWDEDTKNFLLDAIYRLKDDAKISYSWDRKKWWKESE